MLKNYFATALRNLQKQKFFAAINVFGLSAGIACFCLLTMFAVNEFSFDKFHKNAHDVYRAYVWDKSPNGQAPIAYTDYSGPTPITLGEALKQNLPDVKDYVRMQLPWGDNLLRVGKNISRAEVTYADPSLFSVFTFPLKYGNAAGAMPDINDIVLTESRAKQLFGTEDVVGKTIEISIGATFQPFKITAVARDLPENSTVRFDVLGNFKFAQANNNHFYIGSNWHPIVTQTYVQLRQGSKLKDDTNNWIAFSGLWSPTLRRTLKMQAIHGKAMSCLLP